MHRKFLARFGVAAAVSAAAVLLLSLAASSSNGWGAPTRLDAIPGTGAGLNTAALEGCPIESPDGLSLYFASDRPGGIGGIDIWISRRASVGAPWGTPQNAGAPVNSSANDFCPTPTADGTLYFVSNRPGGCGGVDVYYHRQGAAEVVNIGCQANSPGNEFSPSPVRYAPDDGVIFFSSDRGGVQDIYYARILPGGVYSHAIAVSELNSSADDARPNVRADGLEIVFDSTRPGGLGGPDIYVARRASVHDRWSAPVNLGAPINSPAGETRASLSRNGDRLYFGSNRPGGQGNSDIYVSLRDGATASGPGTTAGAAIRPPATGDAGLARTGHTPLAAVGTAAGALFVLALLGRRSSAQKPR